VVEKEHRRRTGNVVPDQATRCTVDRGVTANQMAEDRPAPVDQRIRHRPGAYDLLAKWKRSQKLQR
jgi:hypothetical protein